MTLEDDSHLTLLVENAEGYKNLCHLITRSRCSCPRGKPHVSYADLMSHTSGLIALSGCHRGGIPSRFARGQADEAQRLCRQLLEYFENNFFLELWNHHLTQESIIAQQMLELSQSYSIPWVVTNNVHYATPNKRIIHDVLTCLRHKVTLQTAGRRLRPNGHWYMKSPEEIAYLWRHTPAGITNTQLVAERCQFRLGLLKPSLPSFPLPVTAANNNSATNHNDFLAQLVWEEAAIRYPNLTEKHTNQIKHELELIARLNLAPYFLIMWDIVRFAKSQNIAVQGRGSAANSAVCYCLAITAVDPVEMDFLFERFLSEGRNEPPDIDLDIAHQEREKALQVLARAGALESLCPGRRQALWKVLALAKHSQETPLLTAMENPSHSPKQQTEAPISPMSNLEQTVADYQTLGLSAGAHPMTFYRTWLTTQGIKPCIELPAHQGGATLTVAGAVICRQKPATAKGFVFVTLEDETGMINIVINAHIFKKFRNTLLHSYFLAIKGQLQLEHGVANIIATHIKELPSLLGTSQVPSRNFH